ncbi:hypothetical protein [Deinococcus sp. AB2017081]|uniref:phage NrS-1 polymerase family protein n=1 Tax=Deinococcus sp. AB2017081 TaxID=3093660 RepID=UPI002ACBFE50|nr:hypothetical protein [Deinococcus sp. AB2017081]WQE94668.1 hypothetical protein U2P90_14830 [Deinococcus sp. AB2017081]
MAKIPLSLTPVVRPANHRDPRTQLSFAAAVSACARGLADGVGVVLPPGIVMLDFDDCLLGEGGVTAWVADTVGRLVSYTEISTSGRGLKTFVRAAKPGPRCRGAGCEMYGPGSYAALTGRRYTEVRVISPAGDAVVRLYEELFRGGMTDPLPHHQQAMATPQMEEVVAAALRARNGERFRKLYVDGVTTGYNSPSEADFALLRMLRFWSHADPLVMDALMRRSALYRSKWDLPEGRSYGARSIERALALGGEVRRQRHPTGSACKAQAVRAARNMD